MALNTKMRMMLNSHLAERLKATKTSRIQAIALTTMALLSGNVSAENALLDNISGYVSVEGRYFPNDPAFPKQSKTGGVSLSISPEYKYRTDDDNATFTFNPFYRWDDTDDNRSHGDIRQLDFVTAKGDWEFQVGIGRKFWGVTESQHLVDIINQKDGVEGADSEDKLGQPMIRASKLTENGSIDFYVLPYFRQRTFVGEESRLRFALPVNTDATQYESTSEEKHIDYALRYSTSFDEYDMGLSYFMGTSRDPIFPNELITPSSVTPFYPLIRQYGLDLQYTGESIIWKLEAIHRQPNSDQSKFEKYSAAVGGFEYTLPTISESGAELGILAEYHLDSRGQKPSVAFQKDLFVGARLALNDEDSSELLAGAFVDLDNSTKSIRVEGSRRIGNGLKLNLEAQVFTDVDSNDALNSFSEDDHIKLELQKFF